MAKILLRDICPEEGKIFSMAGNKSTIGYSVNK